MKLVCAENMTPADAKAFIDLRSRLETDWAICSHLAFVQAGQVAAVFVAQKRRDREDARHYVFRAYSAVADGGIEYESRHADRQEAIGARFAAADGHADLIYDNRKTADAAECPYCHAANANVPTGVACHCCRCGEQFYASEE